MTDHPGGHHAAWPAGKGSILELSLLGSAFGQRMVTVHHFEANTAKESSFGTTGDVGRQVWAQAVIDAWQSGPRAAWLAILPSAYVVQTVRAQVVQVPGAIDRRLSAVEEADGSAGTNLGGGFPTASATNAGIVRWTSGVANRHSRGRSYVPLLLQNQVAAGLVSSGTVTLITAYADAMLADFSPPATALQGASFIVFSRPYDYAAWTFRSGGRLMVHEAPPYDGATTPIINRSVDATARVQRRRELGVGA